MRKLLLALALWASLSVDAFASFSVVAHTSAASVNTTSVTTGSLNTTGADLLVLVVSFDNSDAIIITDSKSNTWTGLTAKLQGATEVWTFTADAPATVGSGHTFTVSCVAVCYPSVAVLALSGAAASTFDDENSNGVSGGSSTTTGSVTPAEDNELFVAGLAMDGFASTTINSSFTISNQSAFTGGTNYGVAMAYKIQTTGGAENPTWTFSGSGDAAANLSAFKAATGAAAERHKVIVIQ